MPISVLIVDDSAFFRRRIKEILEGNKDLKVVGIADNGKAAIEKAKELKPDVITMDYEMPLMDGISAVKVIMAEQPTAILMFSSLSYQGARVTLDALDAGALDYLPKSFESMSGNHADSAKLLQEKIIAIARRGSYLNRSRKPSSVVAPASAVEQPAIVPASSPLKEMPKAPTHKLLKPIQNPIESLNGQRPKLIVIGASTGGPVALQTILTKLPAHFPCPILLVQHMPAAFTSAFAERLDRLSQIRVLEAVDGAPLKPGVALLAPGGMQLLVDNSGQKVSIVEGDDRIQYRPSVDVTFGSAARSIRGKILAVVLTGMGQDGREGCKMLKKNGATIWTQSEQSCVVYGMPMSVESAGLSDAVMDANEVGAYLSEIH